jgi:hypothetical protein
VIGTGCIDLLLIYQNENTYPFQFNLTKKKHTKFCSTALKFQTPRTVSNGIHFLYIYVFAFMCENLIFFCIHDNVV